ncbi:MAG: GNAT family N-acetyltransferase [Candidatus Aminicenantes bacterium]|nr:GNAT family N-acetyltransferase [Candidatus Aminicenantes bacterium]
MIRPLRESDLEPVVEIHLASFPGFFLSFLGPGFLKLFYRSFLEDPLGIAYVAAGEDGGLLGCVVGPLRPAGYFKRLLKRCWWSFCLASLPALARRPGIALRLLRAVRYRGDAPGGVDSRRALLSSIAVAPSAQGRGIGRELVEAWLGEARRRGAPGAFLTTDAEGNDAVNAFYRRLGWRLADSYTAARGRRMNRFVFDFPEGGGSASWMSPWPGRLWRSSPRCSC